MASILIVYASKYGQTEKIIGYMEARARSFGATVETFSAQSRVGVPDLADFDVVVVAAPVYVERYPGAIRQFIAEHRDALNAHRCAMFLSVSAAWSAAAGHKAVQTLTAAFLDATGWHPRKTDYLAGAVKYPRYNVFIRWVMRRIVARAGGDTDTRREFEYTDWSQADSIVDWMMIADTTPGDGGVDDGG